MIDKKKIERWVNKRIKILEELEESGLGISSFAKGKLEAFYQFRDRLSLLSDSDNKKEKP